MQPELARELSVGAGVHGRILEVMHKVEDGGAIRMESRGLASPASTCFLKHLFVQSEAESRKFQVCRVLHLAGIHRLPHCSSPQCLALANAESEAVYIM